MYNFNYPKMNRVLDDVQARLFSNEDIETKVDVVGGAIVFFNDALNKAENLDSKLKVDYVNYFYRQMFNLVTKTNILELIEPVSDMLVTNLYKIVGKKKKNPHFNLMIDILIINALYFVQVGIIEGAKSYFKRAIELGEQYLNDSKGNYHDSLCCATNWLGYVYLSENNCKDSLVYYEKTYELYNSVKNLNGFYYKEYNPADVKVRIDELKKILNN